ncbi:cytochrome P450 3A24-like [Ylistrum balloti]|uniref:cytochrome P450 3A24-like n=1 Tax=Ylistrum balloti TaxID=509963 RepID=UPI002905C9CC|nr:cytochrome P450 3A24-like [Ylistrum balloti]
MLSTVLCVIALALLVAFYRQRREKMQVFGRMGIPGPRPHFLFGNLLSFFRKSFYIKYQEWYREYGKTFGYFEGPTAVLVTTNMELLHEVFVKQFKKFHARKVFPVQVDPDRDENVHMFFARGERWRRLRSIINPAFSTTKMRNMTPMINTRIDHLMAVVDTYGRNDDDFDVYDVFQRLTMDTIAECGLGLENSSLKNPDDCWLKHSRKVITDTTKRPFLFLLGFIFPKFHELWITIYKLLGYLSFNPVFWLEEKIKEIVNERKDLQVNKVDLLHLMLNSEYDPNTGIEELDAANKMVRKRLLTTEELTAQSLLFLLAGYETTSTTLAYIVYEMAVNQKVQTTLQEEIDRYFPDQADNPSYDAIQRMEYLDMVWCETLRKCPLASTVVARECMENCIIEGIKLTKGMLIHANVWALHYNAELWGEDPDQFVPERFSAERKRKRNPMAWMPFGSGPRACVGLRLAQLQGKMAMIRLFKNYRIVPSEKLSIPLKYVEGATIIPKNGVPIKVYRRNIDDSRGT